MWQKFKDTLARFMYGRYGADNLGRVLIWGGIIVLLIGAFTGLRILTIIAYAAYIFAIFRMFSRNVEKRRLENQKYLSITAGLRKSTTQRMNRLRNSKQYKYFKCPNCKSYLKLPRGVGEVTVTCGKCKNQFRKKA